jgi:cellulose synthase/poly-beta-1,6-N-acetylglucosamine synthase-like glycosyltransferase
MALFSVLGFFMILGTLGFFSIVPALFARGGKTGSLAQIPLSSPISILIPAHNEEDKIGETLRSLGGEITDSGIQACVFVALDRCTDQTESKLTPWLTKMPLKTTQVDFGSKWQTLKHLLAQASPESEWIVFVDAGTTWESGVLKKLYSRMSSDLNASVLAPSYQILGGSFLSRAFWLYESIVKTLENRLGGPISVHGATVAFRKSVLEKVFRELGTDFDFKNDDIILPLAARSHFPKLRTVYLPNAHIFDHAVREKLDFATQLKRRKRMVLGNLQWIRWLCRCKRVTPQILAVSTRRILRPFWVYGFVLLAVGLGPWALLPIFLFPTAATASLASPFAWLLKWDGKPSAWS